MQCLGRKKVKVAQSRSFIKSSRVKNPDAQNGKETRSSKTHHISPSCQICRLQFFIQSVSDFVLLSPSGNNHRLVRQQAPWTRPQEALWF